MEVLINNQPIFVQEDTSLQSLLSSNNFTYKKGIAVAVNNKVVAKTNWNKYQIQQNDKITIIRASQGG